MDGIETHSFSHVESRRLRPLNGPLGLPQVIKTSKSAPRLFQPLVFTIWVFNIAMENNHAIDR